MHLVGNKKQEIKNHKDRKNQMIERGIPVDIKRKSKSYR